MTTQLTTEQIVQKYNEDKAKRKVYMTKRRIWGELMIEKAKKANIEVSDQEVDKVIASRKL